MTGQYCAPMLFVSTMAFERDVLHGNIMYLLFAFSEDTVCIRELGELPVLSSSKYQDGLTIPLQSFPPFAEASDTTWKSIPPSHLPEMMSLPQGLLAFRKILGSL